MSASLKQSAGPRSDRTPDPALAALALAQWPGEVALLDAGLRVQWINNRFAERLGLEAPTCLGLDWLALHPTAAIHAPAYERAARGEGMELPPFPAHGPARLGFFATTLQPLRADGTVAGLLVTERDVTDAVAESALEERRLALLRAVSEGSRDLVTLLGATGGILFVGEPVLALTGHAASALVGRNIFEFIHPEDLEEVRSKMDSGDVLRTPLRMRRVRYRFRHADGGWRWFESLALNALHDPLLATIVVHSRDVSEEVEHEAALRRRERRFSALTSKSDDLIVVIGADGKAVFESASISRIFGFHPRELTSRRILRLIHPQHRQAATGVARELLARRGAERRLEFMFRDAGGGYRWLEATLVDLTDDPDVSGVLINARDVTGRKVAEAERDSALESAAVYVWEHDLATGQTRWLNDPPGLERFGVLARNHHWDDWLNSVHPDDVDRVREVYAALLDGGSTTIIVEYRMLDPSGDWLQVLVRGRLVSPDSQGCRLLRGVCIDVTERRRIEDELARSREQFRVALDCAQIGFYEWDMRADTLTGLDSWCVAHGVPPESARPGHAARWEALVHPDDRAALLRSFADHLDGHSNFAEAEYRIRTLDDRWLWVFDRAQVTRRGPDGRPWAIAGICMEVDRRRRAERALRETEMRLAATVWAAGIGMWELDTRGPGARWFNDWCQSEDLHPCEGPDHVAEWNRHVHPEDLPRVAALFSDMIEGRREVYESEFRIRTRSGRWTWIYERSRATVRADDGRPLRIVGICMNVDARRQAEQALRKSEFLYRTVAEFTPGYVCEFSFGEDGLLDVSWASEGFADVYGVDPAEFKRRGWRSFLPAAEHGAALQRAERLRRGEQVSAETEVQRADGTRRWLHVTTRPMVEAASGRVYAAIGHAHDITERKLAERALQESQLRLRSIAENSTDWLLQVDRSQRIVFSNRSLRGIPPEQLVGRDVSEFAPPADTGRIREFVTAALAGQLPPTQLEQVVPDGSGRPRVLLVRAQPVNAGTSVVGVVMTITEITRQRRDERMLRLQARILETMREGVVLVDSRNGVRLTNPAFDELFGYRHGTLEGCSVEQLFRLDEATRRAADRRLRAQLAGGRSEPLELDCVRQDGTTFAAACVVTPLSIDGADHWLAVLNDVSERKLLERQILEVSNREQQRIGNDLHDGLGQELTGVALMLRSLATRIRRSHPDALGEVDEIVALLNQSIHNARTLARGLSPVSLERGGLVPALRTLAARARETYGLSLTLRTRVTHPLRLDESAASHLYRIVQEALSNAMRHGRATRVRIQLASDDLAIRLSVHDNGPGLPPEAQRSNGLGLRTMRYRAQVVGGDLLVANHRRGGTIVRCVCPQGARERVSPHRATARTGEPQVR